MKTMYMSSKIGTKNQHFNHLSKIGAKTMTSHTKTKTKHGFMTPGKHPQTTINYHAQLNLYHLYKNPQRNRRSYLPSNRPGFPCR